MKLEYLSLLAAGLLAASSASAIIEIPTVFVGDAGNPRDPFTEGTNSSQTPGGFSSVSYDYYIGTYEVTYRYIPLNAITIGDDKGAIETEDSFDQYLSAICSAYLVELKDRPKITP